MARIAWTPAGSEMGVGTVTPERPSEPLTLERYRGALAGRINRMVRRAGPERASEILAETVEVAEKLMCAAHPETAGELLAWDSETLAERSGMFGETWPIAPEKIGSRSTRGPRRSRG